MVLAAARYSSFNWRTERHQFVFSLDGAISENGIHQVAGCLYRRDDQVASFFLIQLFVMAQGNFLHSPTRLHLGPIVRRILADNRFHRIHHSTDPRHFDKNFGAGTSLWDQLFGTAYFPTADEWPDTGLSDQREAQSVSEYLWRPFGRFRWPFAYRFVRRRAT